MEAFNKVVSGAAEGSSRGVQNTRAFACKRVCVCERRHISCYTQSASLAVCA